MKTVWVIEDGEYSDYHVVGVFTSKENAERIRQLAGGTVAEWDMDPAIEELNAGLWPYSVRMAIDGTTERVERQDGLSSYDIGRTVSLWERTKAPAYRDKPGTQDALMGIVWAESDQHAVKIVNEKRTAYLATGVIP
jgi:hypothetical protein